MTIRIPNENKRLVQSNRSDILGNLWSTWNIDLQENIGRIRAGNKMKLVSSTADDAQLGVPVAFKDFDGRIFTICGGSVFKNSGSNITSAFAEDASSGAVTSYNADVSDLEIFNGVLVSTADTDILTKASDGAGTGAWTDRGNLTSSFPHKLQYFQKFNRVYFTNGTEVRSMDTSYTVATSGDYYISLANMGTAITLAASTDTMWIGLKKSTFTSAGLATGGFVCAWDGISNEVRAYPFKGSFGPMAITIENDSPVVMDANGILYDFNGSGFSERENGRLPLHKNQFLSYVSNTANDRFIHPNGLVASHTGSVLALISNRNNYLQGTTENVNENLPSGIWEHTRENGWVHKHSLTYLPLASTSVTDYGQNRINRAGALAQIKIATGLATSSLICGATYYTNASSTTNGIFIEAPYPTNNATNPEGQKASYFVTTKIESQNVQDTWEKLYVKHRRLLNSSDKIILKYRKTEATPIEISITWVNTTSFTTTTNVSALTGYEVEILQGTGSGRCVHIVSVSGSGTYTVTIDEAVTGVTTGTATARVQNWTKIGSISNLVKEFERFSIDQTSNWIQLKCFMLFTGDNEIEELYLTNKSPAIITQIS
jgi:hypothetical protein